MPKKHPPLPAADELMLLAQASFRNARALTSDAELLLDNDRAPRALALAVLALEETGKAHLCLTALTGKLPAGDFWEEFQLHRSKLSMAAYPETLTGPEPADLLEAARTATSLTPTSRHQRKMRGFYVDYINGRTQTPEEITEAHARPMVELAGRMCLIGERLIPYVSLPEVSQIFGDPAQVEALFQQMLPEFLGDTPEATLRKMRTGFQRLLTALPDSYEPPQ